MTWGVDEIGGWMNPFQRFIVFLKGLFEQRPELRGLASQHPELLDVEHMLRVRSDEEGASGSDYTAAVDAFQYHAWVSKAVRIWGDSLAGLRLLVERDGRVSGEHAVLEILERPGNQQTSADVWRAWGVEMALGGECGVEWVRDRRGRYHSFFLRGASYFAVRPDEVLRRYGVVAGYVLDVGSEAEYFVPPDEFLHFKFYNPASSWRGLSPASAVRLSIVIDQLVQAWSRMFFSNGARPDYAVIAPAGLTASERDEIEFKLSQKFGGSLRAHKPVVLEQGVQDIKVLAFPRKDLEWIAQRRLARDEIGAIWGIPDEIMGYGRDTYENFDTAERVLWSLTLKNLIDFRDDRLTHWLRGVGLLGLRERVVTDVARVWALRRAAAGQLHDARLLFDMGVPFNRVDELLGLGVGPIVGGDVGYVAGSGVAAERVGARPRPLSEVERGLNDGGGT